MGVVRIEGGAQEGEARRGRIGGGGQDRGGTTSLHPLSFTLPPSPSHSLEKILQRSLLSEHNTHYATPKLVFNKFSIKPNEH